MQLKYIPSPSLGLPNKSLDRCRQLVRLLTSPPAGMIARSQKVSGCCFWLASRTQRASHAMVLHRVCSTLFHAKAEMTDASAIHSGGPGANEIASCMEQHIRKNNNNVIKFNSRVMAIGVNKDNTGMDVVTDNKDHHAFYPFSAPSTSVMLVSSPCSRMLCAR